MLYKPKSPHILHECWPETDSDTHALGSQSIQLYTYRLKISILRTLTNPKLAKGEEARGGSNSAGGELCVGAT